MTRLLPTLLTLLASAAWAVVPDGGAPDELGTGDLAGLLDTSVVSGPSRAEERVDDSPATVTVVTSAQLRALGLRTLHEAINFLSLGMVAQDPLHAVEVGARGVLLSGDYGNHFLVVVDGHTLNDSWNSTAYYEQGLAMPIELVDHLELIVGPGSVLYGSSAMLGVVNVVTRRAAEIGLLRVTLEGGMLPAQRADGSLSFAPEGFGGTGRLSLLSGWSTQLLGLPFEVTAAGEYYMHQGQTLEFGKQTGLVEGDGTSEWPQRWSTSGPAGEWGGETRRYSTRTTSFWLKARWGDVTGFGRAASYSRSTPAIDGFGAAVDFDGRGFERDRSLDFELRWARVLNPHLSMMVRGYFDTYEYLAANQSSSFLTNGVGEPPDTADLTNFTFLQESRGHASWGGVEAQATIDWLADGRFPLLLGVDGRGRHFGAANVDATMEGDIIAESNVYEVTEWQVAAYAQQRARLLPSLLLNAGRSRGHAEQLRAQRRAARSGDVDRAVGRPRQGGGEQRVPFAQRLRALRAVRGLSGSQPAADTRARVDGRARLRAAPRPASLRGGGLRVALHGADSARRAGGRPDAHRVPELRRTAEPRRAGAGGRHGGRVELRRDVHRLVYERRRRRPAAGLSVVVR